MKKLTLTSIFVMVCILPQIFAGCGKRDDVSVSKKHYAMLSDALDRQEEYEALHKSKLADLYRKLSGTVDDETRYAYNKLIYELYTFNDMDSALKYIDRNIELAKKNNREDWLTTSLLGKSRVYINTGNLDDANRILVELSRRDMPKQQRRLYYMQRIDYWNSKSVALGVPLMSQTFEASDSLYNCIDSTASPNHLLWVEFYQPHTPEEKELLRQQFKQRIDSVDTEDVWYSPLCFATGIMSMEGGYHEDATDYFARSLSVDIKNRKKQVSSLSIMAILAVQDGDMYHANKFLRAHLDYLDELPDHVFETQLRVPMTVVSDANMDQIRHGMEVAHTVAWTIGILFVIALACVFFLVVSLRRNRKLHTQLKTRNRHLGDRVQQLDAQQTINTSAKEELIRAVNDLRIENNQLKNIDRHVGELFSISAGYLSKLSEFKKVVTLKLKARQFESLLEVAKTDSMEWQRTIQDFYSHFDAIFLDIFPDFVERFNELLQPDKKISTPAADQLNNDLRIYALIWLGQGNSVKIAETLSLSTQSVYNARMKMRNRALPSEISFAERVASLKSESKP